MDIPLVLEQLHPNKYWGPCANSSNTYEQFAAHWPAANGPVPIKAQMETIWQQVKPKVSKTKGEIDHDLEQWLGNDTARLKQLIRALACEKLLDVPGALEQYGIPVRGDKSQ